MLNIAVMAGAALLLVGYMVKRRSRIKAEED
jgi:hypothetical protein